MLCVLRACRGAGIAEFLGPFRKPQTEDSSGTPVVAVRRTQGDIGHFRLLFKLQAFHVVPLN